eukprot:CFRG1822T1
MTVEPTMEAIDITGDGGLMKIIREEGKGVGYPSLGDTVFVHYDGTLLNGHPFDSSRKRNKAFSFVLGQGRVIRGWDIGVGTMRKGEKALLTCAPEYAYGSQSPGAEIPANSTLNFEVELLYWYSGEDITPGGKKTREVTFQSLTPGEGYKNPKNGEEAVIAIKGSIFNEAGDETVFLTKEDVAVVIGEYSDDLPKAIHLALPKMTLGEEAKVVSKPNYAYGADGFPPAVNADTEEVTFVLTLKSWIAQQEIKPNGGIIKYTINDSNDLDKAGEFGRVQIKYRETTNDANAEWIEKDMFQLFEGVLPSGLEMALEVMCKGETARVVVQKEYQDKETEEVTGLPKTYEVENICVEKSNESWDLDDEGKLVQAESEKMKGNEFFKAGKTGLAMRKYARVDTLLGENLQEQASPEQVERRHVVTKSAKSNLAACQLKNKMYTETIKTCTEIIETDKKNVKAYFRRGCALIEKNECDAAEKDLKKAHELESKDLAIKKKLLECRKKMKAQQEREKAIFGKIFA